MVYSFLKYLFIFLGCNYLSCRLLNKEVPNIAKNIFYSIFSVFLAFTSCLLQIKAPYLTLIFPVLITWAINEIDWRHPRVTFVATLIALGISYSILFIANFIILVFSSLLKDSPYLFPREVLITVSGITSLSLINILFRIKRFRKGMPFLYQKSFINWGTIICTIFIALLTFAQRPEHTQLYFAIIITFSLILPIILLMYWWQSQINKSYLAKLQALELESLRNELSEQSRLVESLRLQNAEFGRVQHQYRKLYPALETAVKDLMQKYPEESAHFEKVLAEIHSQESHYNEAIQAIAHICPQSFNSKIPELDTLLTYMDKQAQSKNISFAAYIQDDFAEHILKDVESADINHMLSDLLENAIIATAGSTISKIRLQMYYYQNASVIEIADTGIPFEVPSLLQLGLTPLTTHADSGGSGIGLMDLWSLKKKYRASLHITEYPESNSFHKKIGLVFDKADRYLLSSPRFEELASQSNRVDINILPYTEEAP